MSIFNPFDFKSALVVATRRLYHLQDTISILKMNFNKSIMSLFKTIPLPVELNKQ